MMEKILEIIKKYSYTIVIVAIAVVLTVLVIGFNACGNGDDASRSSSDKNEAYGEFPEFSKAPDSTDISDGYTASYYTVVTGEQVSAYITELSVGIDRKV